MMRSSGPRTASTMQNSDAPSAAVSAAAASTSSVSRKGVAFTGVSKRDDWAQKWQSSGHPPVLADRMPSTSTVGPHHARRTSWASDASPITDSSGTTARPPNSSTSRSRCSSSSATRGGGDGGPCLGRGVGRRRQRTGQRLDGRRAGRRCYAWGRAMASAGTGTR